MGTELTPKIVVTLADGSQVEVGDDDVKASADIRVVCDGSLCDTPCEVKWSQQATAIDPEALPDEAFRLLKLETFDGKQLVFGGKNCLRHYLKSFVPLQSPREKAEVGK